MARFPDNALGKKSVEPPQSLQFARKIFSQKQREQEHGNVYLSMSLVLVNSCFLLAPLFTPNSIL